jgi:hypothetical protein
MSAGGRFEMGVLWGLYCLEHGESLDVGKGWSFMQKRNSPGTPEVFERIRATAEEYLPESGPNEAWMIERVLALISAFLRRHQYCELRVWNDADSRFWWLIDAMNEDPDWVDFSIWLDDPFWDHHLPADEESFERHIRNLRSRLSSLESKLAEGKVRWFLRKRTVKEIERLRKAIPEQIESNAKWMKQMLERRERVGNREPRRDMLEELTDKPILPYPRNVKTSKKRFLKKN